MKKLFIFLFSFLTFVGYAADFKVKIADNCFLFFDIISSSECKLSGITEDFEGTVTVPETVSYSGKELAVTCVGRSAFIRRHVIGITLPKSIKTIEADAFSGCWLEYINFGEGLTTIGESAFSGCKSLKSVVIPDNVQRIEGNAFRRCEGLESIDFGKGLNSIGREAFYSCKSLKSVDIPDNVTKLEHACFGSSGITSVKFGAGLKEIAQYAFSYCLNLKTLQIPNNINKIDIGAFEECENLNSIYIGSGLRRVETNAFEGCSRLQRFECSDLTHYLYVYSKNNLGSNRAKKLFVNGEEVTELVIPNGIKYVYSWAFVNFTNITSVTIPESIVEIGSFAFRGCSKLTDVKVNAQTPPKTGDTTFPFDFGSNGKVISKTLYVPAASKAKYEAAFGWKSFWEINGI